MAGTATKSTRARATRARNKQAAGDGSTPAEKDALEQTGEERAYDPGEHGGAVATAATSKFMDVPVALIEIEPDFNPRQSYDEEALESLAQSIALHGLVQPVLLRPKPGQAKPPRFYLTGGHRRFKASVLAGLQTVPAVIRQGGDVLAAAVLDNSHRVDLNPYEEALVYRRAMDERGLTAKGVAERFSVPQKRVTERLRILNTPEVVQAAIGDGVISSAPGAVQWYVGLQEKSPKLAAAIGAADIKAGGQLDRQGIAKVLKSTAGIIDGSDIHAGSKAFKLRTDDVRAAVKLLESIDNKYSGPEYLWKHGAGSKRVTVRRYYGEKAPKLTVPEAIWQEGVQLGTVAMIEVGEHYHPAVAVLDAKWLQDRLEQELLDAAKSLRAAIAKSKSSTSGKKASELSPSEQREKAHRAAEREKKNREREQAREGNNRLGPALLNHLASVPLTMDSAKALCLLLLKEKSSGYYDGVSRHVGHLAAGGLRFAFPEWKKTVQMKRGEKVELETDVAELERRFWEWWNAASTPEEVIGRTLITFAAMHYHDGREALSKEFVSNGGRSLPGHKDAAAYLERLFDEHAPPTLRKKKRGKGTVRSSSKTLADVFADQGGDEEGAAAVGTAPGIDDAIAGMNAEYSAGTACPHCEEDFVKGDAVVDGELDGASYTWHAGECFASTGVDTGAVEPRAFGVDDEPAAAPAPESASPTIVMVRPGRAGGGWDGEPQEAELQADEHTSNPNLVKVIYVESRTAAWIAKSRIVESDASAA